MVGFIAHETGELQIFWLGLSAREKRDSTTSVKVIPQAVGVVAPAAVSGSLAVVAAVTSAGFMDGGETKLFRGGIFRAARMANWVRLRNRDQGWEDHNNHRHDAVRCRGLQGGR
jgi:hypothetical protein